MKHKYDLSIDTQGAEGHPDEGRWYCYGDIQAYGNTLTELLDSATVDKVDQDGGNFGEQSADEDWMQEAVISAYLKLCGLPEQSQHETLGDLLARAEQTTGDF